LILSEEGNLQDGKFEAEDFRNPLVAFGEGILLVYRKPIFFAGHGVAGVLKFVQFCGTGKTVPRLPWLGFDRMGSDL